MVAQSWLRPRLKAGDTIIVCEAEHHANLVPWLMVAQATGVHVLKLPLGPDRLPDLSRLPALLNERTRLLALGQMSNVTGGCLDLALAISLAHSTGAKVMVDGRWRPGHRSLPAGCSDARYRFLRFFRA